MLLDLSNKSNLSLCLLQYTETCNEFAGPISALWSPGNSAFFEEMSQRCEPLATLYSIWLAQDLNLWPPAPETNALLHDQLFERNHITLTLLFTKWSLYASSATAKYNTSGRKSSKQCSSLAHMMNSSLFPINSSLQKHMTSSEKTHRSPFNSCNLGTDVFKILP